MFLNNAKKSKEFCPHPPPPKKMFRGRQKKFSLYSINPSPVFISHLSHFKMSLRVRSMQYTGLIWSIFISSSILRPVVISLLSSPSSVFSLSNLLIQLVLVLYLFSQSVPHLFLLLYSPSRVFSLSNLLIQLVLVLSIYSFNVPHLFLLLSSESV